MMCSPELGSTGTASVTTRGPEGPDDSHSKNALANRRQRRADRYSRAVVGLRGAVVGQRALYFTTGIADTQRARGALRQGSRRIQQVAADVAGRGRKSAGDSFDRGEQRRPRKAAKVGCGRHPRWHLEDVLQGPPFLDMHGEVRWTLGERETRGRLRQRRAHALQRVGLVRLLRGRRRRGGDEYGRQAGNQAHAVRTDCGSVRPVQRVTYGVVA
jgi:hypothetical protein